MIENLKPSPFAELPNEIILQILTHAASLSKRTAYTLCLVARWTLPLAREALYDVVYLSSTTQLRQFSKVLGLEGISKPSLQLLRKLSPSSGNNIISSDDIKMGELVHHLWVPLAVGAPRRYEKQGQVFDICPNLRSLSIPGYCLRPLLRYKTPFTSFDDKPLKKYNALSRFRGALTQLTLTTAALRYDWSDYSGAPHGHTLLRNLTHLILLDMSESNYIPLPQLRSLTHLAVPFPSDVLTAQVNGADAAVHPFAFARKYISTGSQLIMLVLHTFDCTMVKRWTGASRLPKSAPEMIIAANDFHSNLFILPYQREGEAARLWDLSARRQGSIWYAATEALKEAKISGQSLPKDSP